MLLAANESRRDAPWRRKSSLSSRPSTIGRRQAPAGSLTRGMRFTALPFLHEWLRRVTNAPPGQLAVIEADGDSMKPTIRKSDHMLVGKTQTNPRRDGIYVICWDGWINVKRVTTDPARRVITVSSDNPAYPANEAVKPGDLVALGPSGLADASKTDSAGARWALLRPRSSDRAPGRQRLARRRARPNEMVRWVSLSLSMA